MGLRLTLLEIDVLLGMIGDVDPAHFEEPDGDETVEARNLAAADRAKEKLKKRYWELVEKEKRKLKIGS